MIAEAIRAKALELGFAEARIASAGPIAGAAEHLAAFLAAGCHGDMAWLAETAARREAPQALWPEARSIVVVGDNYGPQGDPLAGLAHPDRGNISVYARGRDYHDGMKKRLRALARWLVERLGGEVKAFVDTAPVMEKPLAEQAGLGWQGRHTNLVSRRFGSWLFLGALFTSVELPADTPEDDHCGRCRACESACPTGALAAGKIEPRRCISYLTIEHKAGIAPGLRSLMGNRIYGCDDCLAVCPWNKFAVPATAPDYLPRGELTVPLLADLAGLDDAAFRRLFAGSPVKRTGRDRFVRNVLIAVGNSAVPALAPVAVGLLADAAPPVRGMAIWATRRLLPAAEVDLLARRYRPTEDDPSVLDEWDRP